MVFIGLIKNAFGTVSKSKQNGITVFPSAQEHTTSHCGSKGKLVNIV